MTSINKTDIVTTPTTYQVKPGDTYASIALSQFGTDSYASLIATRNEDSPGTVAPSVSRILTLPQFIPMTNTANDVVPYKTFQNEIYGKLLPVLIFAAKPKKQDCSQTIVMTAIVTVSCIVAPELATAMLGVGFEAILAGAAMGAMLDASLQGIAVGVGVIKRFSLESVVEAGVMSGFNTAFPVAKGKIPLSIASLTRQISLAAAMDLSEQVIEVAAGLKKKIDLKETEVAMASAGLMTVVGNYTYLGDPAVGDNVKPIAQAALDDCESAFGSALMGAAIMGGKYDVESAAAQALGSFIGMTLGQTINHGLSKTAPPPTTTTQKFNLAYDTGIADYQRGLLDAQPGDPQSLDLPTDAWTADQALHQLELEEADYIRDAQSSSNKPLGSSDAPKPKTPPAPTSEAKPNNYINLSSQAKMDLDFMIKFGELRFLDQHGWLARADDWTQYPTNTRTLKTYAQKYMTSLVQGQNLFISSVIEKMLLSELPLSSQLQIMGDFFKNQWGIIKTSSFELAYGTDPSTGLPSSRWEALKNLAESGLNVASIIPADKLPALGLKGLLGKSMMGWMGVAGKTDVIPELVNKEALIKSIEEYLGEGMEVLKPEKGSDLILRSEDRTKQIRFDITNSHGLDPHVNIETYEPRNLFPGDPRMIQTENLHVFPQNTLENQDLLIDNSSFKK